MPSSSSHNYLQQAVSRPKPCKAAVRIVYFRGNVLMRKVGSILIMPRLPKSIMRAAVITVLGLVMAVLSTLAGLFGASAAHAAPLGSVPAVSVTVPAGGSATLQVRGLALQPGSLLPQGALALGQQTLATERVRTAL